MTANVGKLIKQAREIGKKNPLAFAVIEALIDQINSLQDEASIARDTGYSDGLADGQENCGPDYNDEE